MSQARQAAQDAREDPAVGSQQHPLARAEGQKGDLAVSRMSLCSSRGCRSADYGRRAEAQGFEAVCGDAMKLSPPFEKFVVQSHSVNDFSVRVAAPEDVRESLTDLERFAKSNKEPNI